MMEKKIITLDDVRKDWRILDDENVNLPAGVRLISHENFSGECGIPVEYVAPWNISENFNRIPVLYWFLYAVRLFKVSDDNSVLIINGGVTFLWIWCGIINLIPGNWRRKLLCWDVFVEYKLGKEKRIKYFPFIKITNKTKKKFARYVIRQYGLNVLWSKKQILTHAKEFNLPDEFFIFIPYKANHSKRETYDIAIGNFVFAGGNGKRDYQCLIDAVKGTDVPVIISSTDPAVRKTIDSLTNVIILAAYEPAFAQLQAASRFVVVPLIYSGLKGGGEANFCNAMWHKKPVIAVDSMSAENYVVDGETGFIVASGDVNGLREKILKLWGDPEECRKMGEAGRAHIEESFTHEKFIRRLLRLACVYGGSL